MNGLPENLNSYAKTANFIEVSSSYKSDAIKAMLDEMGVDYLANDNKTALVYRLLEAQGNLPVLSAQELEAEEAEEYADDVEAQELEAEEVQEPEPITATSDGAVVVESRHYRNLLEPATGTLILPQTRTKIYPTAYVSRERIIENLTQIGFLHQDLLTILEG